MSLERTASRDWVVARSRPPFTSALGAAEFIKIYDIDPDFDLAPAEAGHPSWTRTFAGAKAQAKKAQADKAKKQAP